MATTASKPTLGIRLVSLIVHSYDEAIDFFVRKLGFTLVEDSPATTSVGGRPKRWVVVRPPNGNNGEGGGCSILLAQADGAAQVAQVGQQFAGRVGLFWQVDDFDGTRCRMLDHGVQFVSEPRNEPYGKVVIFIDVAGNKWDLLGPAGGE